MRLKQRRVRVFTSAILVISLLYFLGIYDYVLAKDFDDSFEYPLNVDLEPLVNQIMTEREPSLKPINEYPYKFITNNAPCNKSVKLDLVIIVKSAMDHFGHRDAIRKTWGQPKAVKNKVTKLFFVLGITDDTDSQLQADIDSEIEKYNDIVQADFVDNYYNNTIKTMMGFRWLYNYCSTAEHYLFSDDDMYISTRNVFKYIENLEKGDSELNHLKKDGHMFAGYVFDSMPQRHRGNKWRVSLEEYPWDRWPVYVTAGAYILSNKTMKTLYAGSLFVQHFKFDDIYLAIVAKKIGVTPIRCSEFYFYKKKYTKEGYRDAIAVHGYRDHEELINVWNEQNSE